MVAEQLPAVDADGVLQVGGRLVLRGKEIRTAQPKP
jgi:hypothetical protein